MKYYGVVYCTTCAEKKLGKLQGTNKAKLTSKDVLASLSEAREDHMRQLLTTTEATSTSLTQNNISTDLCEPWRMHNTVANMLHIEHDDNIVGSHIEIAQQQYPRTWRWLWCTCCSKRPVTNSGAISSGEQPSATLTHEEENACLLDCDELGLTWGNDGVTDSHIIP
jgi:hypothetical protein